METTRREYWDYRNGRSLIVDYIGAREEWSEQEWAGSRWHPLEGRPENFSMLRERPMR